MDITNQIITGTFKLYGILLPYGWIAIAVMIFIVAPLSLFKKLRAFTGTIYFAFSYFIGFITWLLGFGITLATLGWLGVLVGMGLFAVGVIPLAIVGLLIEGQQYDMILSLLGMIFLIYLSRIFGIYLIELAEDN